MNDEKQETIEDIVAEMRSYAKRCREENFGVPPAIERHYHEDDVEYLADRIDEAWKQQFRDATKMIPHGNAKKMRKALLKTRFVIAKCIGILSQIPRECEYDGLIEDVADELCELREENVNAALSSPPRNCDVGTAEEQSARFDAHCRTHMGCFTCPLREKDGGIPKHCEFAWAQMPYEEGGSK